MFLTFTITDACDVAVEPVPAKTALIVCLPFDSFAVTAILT